MKGNEGYVRRCVLCVILLSVILASGTVFGATLRVPDEYFTIQKAIDAASALDVVIVADGTWKGTGFKNLDVKLITVRSENGPEKCIIDCEGDGTAFSVSGNASEVSGFTITNASDTGIVAGDSSTISNCIITENVGDSGGGVDCGSATIRDCLITGNRADDGGGVYSYSGNPIIANCIISDNFANRGAGIYSSRNANISGCTISNNLAGEDGGGVYFVYENNISNCVIINNTASNGGGFYFQNFGSPIINCTVVNNESANPGGGIHGPSHEASLVVNSILWGNTPDQTSGELEIYYSDVQGGFSGIGNIDADPLLGNDNHLKAGSPCIDAGTSEMDAPDTDIDGASRPQGSGHDIGADEASADSPNDPTANAGSDQITGDEITLYGSKSFDPDGSIASYQWELRHKANSLYNKTVSGETVTVSELKKGFYDVTLTVTDDSGAVNSDEMFFSATGDPTKEYDISGDGKAGLAEVIYYLQILSGKN
ncbi:right-handed parallel beta-helix repeat-containing protein [Desulfococcaceae bacterium HSG8]|nr:right-handed parallel beta-helix repeat-containing protein [Desulfococcaceae bacterium HSG8]